LSPAKISRVTILDPVEHHMEVIVDDSQLSLAIGKKGQNVRLASKLIGWNVDIKSEEEKRREIEAQMAALTAPGTSLSELAGVGPKTIEKLEAAGITSIEKLADMTPEQLVEIPGIGEKMVEKIHQSVAAYFENLEAQQAAAAEATSEEGVVEGGPMEGEVAQAEAPTEVTALGEAEAEGDMGDESNAELEGAYERGESVSEGSETPVARDESQAERLETEQAPAEEQSEE